ncbi:MAG: energy transducer TonB [Muribaculaceae bacterium]|nr:energy transducer TonB [Muribaculaceae bacterium]
MRRLFVILLVALVPMMALEANGTELRKDKKAKTEKVNKKKKKGKVKEVVVGYGADDPDFIDDGLMNGLPPCNHDSTAAANHEQEYELVKTKGADTEVFRDPYSMPFYPGGDHALIQDLAENLVYPPEAVKEGTQGRVILQFVIKKDGSIDIDNIKVTRSLSPECDQAAIEAVKKLKKFKPGLKDAKPVNVKYTLPVSFKLPAEE